MTRAYKNLYFMSLKPIKKPILLQILTGRPGQVVPVQISKVLGLLSRQTRSSHVIKYTVNVLSTYIF